MVIFFVLENCQISTTASDLIISTSISCSHARKFRGSTLATSAEGKVFGLTRAYFRQGTCWLKRFAVPMH